MDKGNALVRGFLADWASVVSEHEPLAPHTWFGLGGCAHWMAQPQTAEQLGALVRRCGQEGVPLRILGLGSNLLVSDDGVEGVVVRLKSAAFREVAWGSPQSGTSEEVAVKAGGGVDMSRLILDATRRGLSGLECMGGIPGTVGGAVRMNAGGRFGTISQVVRDVTVVDATAGQRRLSHDEVGFGYRHTNLGDAAVCRATLVLRRDDPAKVRERLLAVWEHKQQTQPLGGCSAGCVFKNPPGYSAGELIDRARLKGRSVGGAAVSQRHANFILVKEGATAADVMKLIGIIRREVANRFGVELELEIQVWGRWAARDWVGNGVPQ